MKDIYDSVLSQMENQLKKTEKKDPIPLAILQETSTKLSESFMTSQPAKLTPVMGVRSSEPDNGNGGFIGKNAVLVPDFPLENLALLEYLAVKNRHVSYAVENVVTLASTEYEIFFSDSVPSALQNKMKTYIKERADNYYEFSGGQTVLINDFFCQVAIYGATSFEKVPLPNLKGLKKVVRVSPKWVRSVYNSLDDNYSWVQQPRYNINKTTVGGYIPLNPLTYSYIGLRHINESPYAVPPFLAALEDLITEYDMIGSFKTMMKKMGMLGMLSVLVTAPEQREGEDEQDYYVRISDYLRTYVVPEVEKQMSKGVAVGIKGNAEFKLEGQNMNTAGAENLMKIIKGLIFSGLKQDPNLHGENYSVTETFGKVILSKMSMQIRNYQQIVAKSLEEIFMLDLVLAGFAPGYIEVKFKMPSITDQLKDEQSEQIKIANVLAKRNAGIIDQMQAANELGYDAPALKEAPPLILPGAGAGNTPTNTATAKKKTKKPDKSGEDVSAERQLSKLIKKMKGDTSQYDYTYNDCENHSFDASTNDPFLEKQIKNYNNAVTGIYEDAVNKAVSAVGVDLRNENKPQTPEAMADIILVNLYKSWDRNFSQQVKPTVQKFVSGTYEKYRKDKSIFKYTKKSSAQNSFFTAPDGMYSLPDFRTVDYLERSDDFYLGKFIADKDTRNRIIQWTKDYYIANGNPIGKDDNLIVEFLKEFTNLANLEAYKIRRITETTLNKSRNYACTMFISQAQVAKFQVVEIGDQKTCEWCQHMDGKTFETQKMVDIIQELAGSPVEDVPTKTPFATTIKIADFKLMDVDQLEKAGFLCPPFHCHCRGRLVADL